MLCEDTDYRGVGLAVHGLLANIDGQRAVLVGFDEWAFAATGFDSDADHRMRV